VNEQPKGAVRFSYDRQLLCAPPGLTVAGALIANGELAWRTTRRGGRPGGLFCGIGYCHECLVDVGEHAAVRACQVVVRDGDEIRPAGRDSARRHPDMPGEGAENAIRADVAVIGAGPAGMSAALGAADAGCSVLLIDASPKVGGQIYRQDRRPAHRATNPVTVTGALPPRLRRVETHPRIRLVPDTTVWYAQQEDRGFRLHCSGGAYETVGVGAVILAPGAGELVFPFPGWTLPGVVTAGAAQAMIKGQDVLIGRRVLVAGTGPLLLPVAAGLAQRGARVVAVCEAVGGRAFLSHAPRLARHPARLLEACRYAAALARHGIRYLDGHAVIACEGDGRVERASLAPVDSSWRVTGPPRTVAVDAVAVSVGFVPQLELSRMLACRDIPMQGRPAAAVAVGPDLATSTRGVFAAGEITGIGGAPLAELEGAVAGPAAARHLGRLTDVGFCALTADAQRRITAARRFAALIDDAFPLADGWLERLRMDTVVCRCEDVTWGEVAAALRIGTAEVRGVKGLTRCGMGYCQGRVCGPVLQYLIASDSGRPLDSVGDLHTRTLGSMVPLGRLAAAATVGEHAQLGRPRGAKPPRSADG
jgi:D-hydroxyproline dehydrogenase subunit alpha